MKIIAKNEKETFSLAKTFAQKLKGGEIIGLIGDLGAGKTVFTQGLAQALKIKQVIASPTFVIMKVYPVKHKTIKQLVHIDAYRIKSAADIVAIGAIDYFNRADTVTVIEWADNIKNILPSKTKYITIKIDGEKRQIELG